MRGRAASAVGCGGRVAAVLALVAASAVQAAEPARLAWSTYLRAGPGETRPVLDELEHGAAVAVGRCAGRWCAVEADGLQGFVDRDALALPAPPAPSAAAHDCVLAGQQDARRPMPTRFCTTPPPAR